MGMVKDLSYQKKAKMMGSWTLSENGLLTKKLRPKHAGEACFIQKRYSMECDKVMRASYYPVTPSKRSLCSQMGKQLDWDDDMRSQVQPSSRRG